MTAVDCSLCPLLLVAACSGPESTAPAAPDSSAVTAPAPASGTDYASATAETGPQAEPAAVPGGHAVAMAGSMAAMVEFCGLVGGDLRAQTLANLQKAMGAQGMSSADVERRFEQAYAATKAKAASDPTRAQAECASLKRMNDPAEVQRMQEATKRLEAQVKAMKG